MTQSPPPDSYVQAKLLGILLSGIFGQTRPECSAEARLRLELSSKGKRRLGSEPPNESER